MFNFSKVEPVKTIINGKTYKTKKWSTLTTSLEGMKIAKVLAPSFAIIADLWMNKTEDQKEMEKISKELEDMVPAITGAVTQLCASLEDEHFTDLVDKLLRGLQVVGEDNEAKDIGDIDVYFDENQEDFIDVLTWSIKVNLLDFFMKQATFASKIEMLKEILTTMTPDLEKLTEKSTNSES